MQQYYILIKASGGPETPELLPYRLKAKSAEAAMNNAKREAEVYYPYHAMFEVLTIEVERRNAE